MSNNLIHKSITDEYIKEYVNLINNLYPTFFTRINATYYSLNVEQTNFDTEFKDMYKQANSIEHGGRYDCIYNLPIYLISNNAISETANEKGISTVESTDINCIIDPLINLIPKDRDMISFRLGIENDVLYTITNLELSSTLSKPYTKLSLRAFPNLNTEKMKTFVCSQNGFIPEYHYIFNQKEVFTILKLQNIIKDYITYFNKIYDSKLDAHINQDSKVFLEFEKAFNNMIDKYTIHLSTLTINKSYLYENLLSYYNEDNPYNRMLYSNNGNFNNYNITTIIKRLDKIRRRTINNKYKIYRLINTDLNKEDNIILNNYNNYINILTLPSNSILEWDLIVKPNFLNNVKEVMTRFLDKKCIINPDDMFENAIRLAQCLFLLDSLVKTRLESRYTNVLSH